MRLDMQLPIGYDNFAAVIDKKLDFVDKTLFIRDVIDDITTTVTVITRPRRFGKTLNLSMLQYFFAAEAYGRKTRGLFDGLKIAGLGEDYMQHQGKYPVIFMTLKDVRDRSLPTAVGNLHELIRSTYQEHAYVLNGTTLSAEEKTQYHLILAKQADPENWQRSLRNLSEYLFRYTGQKVWLLIDEYDTPIQSAFLHGYYAEMIDLIRGLFGAALKTNPYLEKAVITGILRIAKESLFSGLNNVTVHTLLDSKYGEYFGFTEAEMTELLTQANLDSQADEIRHWYNGYLAGDTVIYNPWSIANCLNENGRLRPYWVNTSGNDLIRELLARGDESLKDNLERLLAHQPIEALIDEYTVFGDLERNNDAFWSLLLFSGYLKAIRCQPIQDQLKCVLIAPNYEVRLLYQGIIRGWFSSALGYSKYEIFLKSLTRGDVEEFTLRLQDCLQDTFSIFDVTGRHPEKFYHGFVLGLMVSLEATHEVQSNKESRYGRYDVMLIPKDRTQLGIVMEFKTVVDDKVSLSQAAEQALQQIIERNYAQHLRNQGVEKILHLGLAFYHKTVAVTSQ